MKKILTLLLAAVLLVGCTPREPDEVLNYPGLQWGMTFEAVADVLNISEEQILEKREYRNASQPQMYYEVSGLKLFERQTSVVGMRFLAYGDQEPGLGELVISYPDDTDREALIEDLQEIYGAPGTSRIEERWYPGLNQVIKEELFVPEGTTRWFSELTYLNAAELETLEKAYDRQLENYAAQGLTEFPTFEAFLTGLDRCVTTVTLYRSYNEQHHPYSEEELARGWTDTVLTLNATGYLEARNLRLRLGNGDGIRRRV